MFWRYFWIKKNLDSKRRGWQEERIFGWQEEMRGFLNGKRRGEDFWIERGEDGKRREFLDSKRRGW